MSTSDSFSLLSFNIRIWRKERHLKNCPVHFFSTHFFTALEESGPEAVVSWTVQKNIDVFGKKYIFIPINQTHTHWSLCCVVNPGFILNNVKALKKDPRDDEPYPCMFFFDSLSAPPKESMGRSVRKWLNSEWTRLKMGSNPDESQPFEPLSLLVHNPKGMQLGSIDLLSL
jgi:Ulp1 family protease